MIGLLGPSAGAQTTLSQVASASTLNSPHWGVSVDGTTVRAAGSGTTVFQFDMALAPLANSGGVGQVSDLATGTARTTQTVQFSNSVSPNLSLYQNAGLSTQLPGFGYNAPSASLGVGAAIDVGGQTYTTLLTNLGEFRLIELSTQAASTLWTLPSTTNVTGLDTFLRPGGTAGILSHYAAAVSYSTGIIRLFDAASGASLGGDYVVQAAVLVGSLTDVAYDPGTQRLYASFDDNGELGSVRSYDFSPYVSAIAIPEPSTYAALVGLIALGATCWRRRR